MKQLRRREDADDATQTTFMYALLSLRRGVTPRAELPWLYAIASNVCSSRRRSGQRRGQLELARDLHVLQDELPTPERHVPATAGDFRSALRAIPGHQRDALLLREWKGLSYDEISAELGLSKGATETLLFRARQNLARKLEEKTGYDAAKSLSLLPLIQALFQRTAATTLAVGLGATATIASTPSADHQARHHADAPTIGLSGNHNATARSPIVAAQPARKTPPAAHSTDRLAPHHQPDLSAANGPAVDVGIPTAISHPDNPKPAPAEPTSPKVPDPLSPADLAIFVPQLNLAIPEVPSPLTAGQLGTSIEAVTASLTGP